MATMTEERVATVRMVNEDEASGKVASIFDDIKATKSLSFVPNFWRVLATNPDHLELVWTNLKTLMHPETVGRQSKLDPLTREIIALAVSATTAAPIAPTPTPRRCASWGWTSRRWARCWRLSACSTPPTPWPTATRWNPTCCRRWIDRRLDEQGAFELQQAPLGRNAAGVTGQPAVGPHHPVTRNDDGYGVAPVGVTHGPHRGRLAKPFGDLPVVVVVPHGIS